MDYIAPWSTTSDFFHLAGRGDASSASSESSIPGIRRARRAFKARVYDRSMLSRIDRRRLFRGQDRLLEIAHAPSDPSHNRSPWLNVSPAHALARAFITRARAACPCTLNINRLQGGPNVGSGGHVNERASERASSANPGEFLGNWRDNIPATAIS